MVLSLNVQHNATYTAFTLFGPTRHSMAQHKTASNNTTFTLVKSSACGTNATNHATSHVLCLLA